MPFLSPIIVYGNLEPHWQAGEDAIVGGMLRQLFSFEGKPLDNNTLLNMESIIEVSARQAEDIGARGDYVRSVGTRLLLNGRSVNEWHRLLPHPRYSNLQYTEVMCLECGAIKNEPRRD